MSCDVLNKRGMSNLVVEKTTKTSIGTNVGDTKYAGTQEAKNGLERIGIDVDKVAYSGEAIVTRKVYRDGRTEANSIGVTITPEVIVYHLHCPEAIAINN